MSADGEAIAIWGAGGHARVVAECLRLLGRTECVFVESPVHGQTGETIMGRPLLCEPAPKAAVARLMGMGVREVVLGFGQCQGRLQIGGLLIAAGFLLPAIVHPSAVVAQQSVLGSGVFVAAGCVIDPSVSIGDYTILNNRVVVCHETSVGRAAHLCPGVTVAGVCSIGERAWIGAGGTLRDRVRIGDGAYVGCGSNVVSDVPSGALTYGNPARIVGSAPDVF
jgi:sugar O-acyltransferase (sialic acid O-acetyltransferase NeuD family)